MSFFANLTQRTCLVKTLRAVSSPTIFPIEQQPWLAHSNQNRRYKANLYIA